MKQRRMHWLHSDDVLQIITPPMEVRFPPRWRCRLQVPVPDQIKTRFFLSLRWLVLEANKRSNKQYHTFG